jgi:farnesyl-diphosphate farnesyltransferase
MAKDLNSPADLLGVVLRDVSRSFYLTLRVLPNPLRVPIGLAYLLARAADTISDTEMIPVQDRLDRLLQLRNLLMSRKPISKENVASLFWKSVVQDVKTELNLNGEEKLLLLLPECFELFASLSVLDQDLVVSVVTELTRGMEMDLQRFSNPKELTSLQRFEDLEEYTYFVAGCVGPFWTKICMAHIPELRNWNVDEMCALGIRFGKALQWTNILRDIPRDLQNGRCYLPSDDLAKIDLDPEDLKTKSAYSKFKRLYHHYLDHALEHYRAAWKYTKFIPPSSSRVLLSCVWPQWIGLETIAKLRSAENPLDPARRIKIPRKNIYLMMIRSVCSLPFPSAIESHQYRLMEVASGARNSLGFN